MPAGFYSQKLWGLIFPAEGPGVGLGLLAPEIYLPDFYPPCMDVGEAHSASVSLLPVWMDVVSLMS